MTKIFLLLMVFSLGAIAVLTLFTFGKERTYTINFWCGNKNSEIKVSSDFKLICFGENVFINNILVNEKGGEIK